MNLLFDLQGPPEMVARAKKQMTGCQYGKKNSIHTFLQTDSNEFACLIC